MGIRRDLAVFCLTFFAVMGILLYPVLSQPPPINTIEHDEGLYFENVAANNYWFRGVNLTDLFLNITDLLENFTGPIFVPEATVEWGLVEGTTGNWFNHTLPGEPVAIILQMHPDNLTIAGQYVIPNVYDKSATQWQLEVVWLLNGTQCYHDVRVMYHMRWERGLEDPNDPQEPAQEPL